MTRVTWGPWESKRIAMVVKCISSREISENSIKFSLSNSEQRDSWLNSGHQTLDADKEDRCSLLITTWCMFPGILLSAKVLKYGCVIIHTSVLIVFEILRLVCITIYILFILTITRFYILSGIQYIEFLSSSRYWGSIFYHLTLGYYPQQWRTAVAVALQKPNKPDYTQPHAYRLITLLECMGKILEKIIACRLTFMVGHYKLISGAQSRGKANSATTDVILSFVYDIHTAWNHGKVMSALTFDIKRYFDFINHDRLLVEIQKHRIPLEYLK